MSKEKYSWLVTAYKYWIIRLDATFFVRGIYDWSTRIYDI